MMKCRNSFTTDVGQKDKAFLPNLRANHFRGAQKLMTISTNILYKYRAYSARSLEMLIRRELYFAAPASLNDPYDCQINIRDSLAIAIERATDIKNIALRQHQPLFVHT